MSGRYDLVIFDANVIIYLAQIGKLENLLNVCTIYMTSTVISESQYYYNSEGKKIDIDINSFIEKGMIIEEKYNMSQISNASAYEKVQQFIRLKRGKIDLGELEAIYFISDHNDYKFCCGDAAAIKLLAYIDLPDNAISLEQIIGTLSGMKIQYTEKFMKDCLAQGSKLMIEDL